MWDIMVNVGRATEAEPAVRCGVAMARRHGAFLTGLQIVPVNPVFLGTADAIGLLALEEGEAESRQLWWEALCRRHEVAGAWEVLRGMYELTLAKRSLLADVMVSPLPVGVPEAPTVAAELTRVLFSGSSPMLLVPEAWHRGFDFRRVAVGWNGSAEALRAIHAALPLLRGADEVLVYDGDRADLPGGRPSLPIQGWLTRHGVKLRWVHFDPEQDVGPALHDEALAQHAELLVMGAWGRSRMSELMLGGATRWLLGNTRLPLFLAH
ncbi:universal stress protein [Dyella sp. BiH032]|uniref:universal stress protein n=1 Tax=Dyella sp. BiH032 TaxID=3075430 RepID=UPI002892EB8B|nr:universal stress protein [Dyella sp. BiH032]WNL47157.1 universal stress protein [Dyella sp. BiH032]